MSKIYQIDYVPVLASCVYDRMACFIVSKTPLSDAEIDNAIDHPTGEIVIKAVIEVTKDEMYDLKVPMRVIYLDKLD